MWRWVSVLKFLVPFQMFEIHLAMYRLESIWWIDVGSMTHRELPEY